MGDVVNHPMRATHLATGAVEAALLGEAAEAVFGRQPVDALIDLNSGNGWRIGHDGQWIGFTRRLYRDAGGVHDLPMYGSEL